MSAVDIIAAHQQLGITKFSHKNGQCYVEFPMCGCKERMHPRDHPQHVLDALTAAGYTIEPRLDKEFL